MSSKNTPNSNFDYTLVFIILLLAIVSCFAIYTVQPFLPSMYEGTNFVLQQIVWYILGSMVIVVMMLVDYDRYRQVSWILYGIGMITLLMLFLNVPAPIIHEVNGARSWFIFPGIGTIQPAEFMKVFLINMLAHVMVSHNEKFKIRTIKSDLWLLLKILVLSLPPMGLVATQPDLGGFLVLCAIVACMTLVSGIRWRILLTIMLTMVVSIGIVVWGYINYPDKTKEIVNNLGFGHVESRFLGWLYPEAYGDSGYQLIRAMLSIGSGQLTGKGMHDLEVYIPERHTDMIFSAIAEQFGFLGASFVITLFFLLIYRLIHIGLQSNDQFGSFLVTGIIGMFTFQIFQNIGMSVQLLPITGLPLPFISYGGSSTLTYLMAIGIVLNIKFRTKTYMFD
ncbi:FtsW/RodA/SpoVE family cell cycle protein [Aquibacillus koreensis]|uniref:FtsW/RodA/SpoVE family cell cycle protein n=1 Tax=Aquibacillus koreensis TaxID=279446 RepID=A0A9X3WK14_9BACI|nr:FtsW/RodA/SpoVE family cell cycle protein [Aquibacillus koreensis]MCT2535667.1 FtsW/RodA/SpoVE family cell cycle protein [Aquibacillus koreensis]MDC3420048.1 FtsW/RodA/SpoVE family cell cycle protein [Aquibacillus koreensis]